MLSEASSPLGTASEDTSYSTLPTYHGERKKAITPTPTPTISLMPQDRLFSLLISC